MGRISTISRWGEIEYKPAPLLTPTFGPLSGIQVLLNGTVVTAPFFATMVSDFEVEMIALERPEVDGDPARRQKSQVTYRDKSISGSWMQDVRNKPSISLETNLNVPESKEIFLSLVKNLDVWIENMVWLSKLGISDETLLEVDPKLVICHISGFDTSDFGGEEKHISRPGYDPLEQTESGWSLLQGWPGREPYYAQWYIRNYLNRLFAVNDILMAHMSTQGTGKGRSVEISLTEGWMRVMNDNFTLWMEKRLLKQRQRIKQTTYQPGGIFPTKDGKHINLGSYGKAVYEKVLKGFSINTKRFSYEKTGGNAEAVASPLEQKLDAIFQKFFLEHTADEALEICIANKIGATVVRDAGDVYEQTHWRERRGQIKYTDQTLQKEIEASGFVPKFSETPGQVWCGAPALGRGTELVLRQLLDYSEEEMAALKGRGVID